MDKLTSCQEAFEVWWPELKKTNAVGRYSYPPTEDAWNVWRAAWEYAQSNKDRSMDREQDIKTTDLPTFAPLNSTQNPEGWPCEQISVEELLKRYKT